MYKISVHSEAHQEILPSFVFSRAFIDSLPYNAARIRLAKYSLGEHRVRSFFTINVRSSVQSTSVNADNCLTYTRRRRSYSTNYVFLARHSCLVG